MNFTCPTDGAVVATLVDGSFSIDRNVRATITTKFPPSSWTTPFLKCLNHGVFCTMRFNKESDDENKMQCAIPVLMEKDQEAQTKKKEIQERDLKHTTLPKPEKFKWSAKWNSPVIITNEGSTVTCSAGPNSGVRILGDVVWTEGIHYFECSFQRGDPETPTKPWSENYFGVVPIDCQDEEIIGWVGGGWSYCTLDGSSCFNKQYNAFYSSRFKCDGINRLGVLVDMDHGTIEFVRNKVKLGIAYGGLCKAVRPAACIANGILMMYGPPKEGVAIIYAAASGDLASVKLLLESKIRIDTDDEMGETALIKCCLIDGSIEVAKFLLENKANMFYQKKTGQEEERSSALHVAAESGRVDLIDELLKNGCNINFTNSRTKATALAKAAYGGHVAATEFLLLKGANKNIKCQLMAPKIATELTAGQWASFYQKSETARLLGMGGTTFYYQCPYDNAVIATYNGSFAITTDGIQKFQPTTWVEQFVDCKKHNNTCTVKYQCHLLTSEWVCEYCTFINNNEGLVCGVCEQMQEQKDELEWTCKRCTLKNKIRFPNCLCGTPRGSVVVEPLENDKEFKKNSVVSWGPGKEMKGECFTWGARWMDSTAFVYPKPTEFYVKGFSVTVGLPYPTETVRLYGETIWTDGAHYFEISFLSAYKTQNDVTECYIGVIQADSLTESNLIGYQSNDGWSYCTFEGDKCYGNRNYKYSNLQFHCDGKDRLGVLVDMNQRTIEFVLNGKRLGIAARGISPRVRPAVSIVAGTITLHQTVKFDPTTQDDMVEDLKYLENGDDSKERKETSSTSYSSPPFPSSAQSFVKLTSKAEDGNKEIKIQGASSYSSSSSSSSFSSSSFSSPSFSSSSSSSILSPDTSQLASSSSSSSSLSPSFSSSPLSSSFSSPSFSSSSSSSSPILPLEAKRVFVASFFSSIGMRPDSQTDYISTFIDNGWECPSTFMNLTEEDLTKMGVKAGHVKMIMKRINALRSSSIQPSSDLQQTLIWSEKVTETEETTIMPLASGSVPNQNSAKKRKKNSK